MNLLKKHKTKIVVFVSIIAILAIAFFCTGNDVPTKTDNPEALRASKVLQTENKLSEKAETQDDTASCSESSQGATQATVAGIELSEPQSEQKENTENSHKQKNTPDKQTIVEDKKVESASVMQPAPVETDRKETNPEQFTCTLSVRCDNAIGKSDGKAVVIPDDGIIFPEKKVVFYEGESVFNVLVREMKKHKIHLEFVNVPIYNSAYIEGINNLYEFDCGELSGWMYKVNDWYPNYGCSGYELKNGDKIEWVYTCDLGKDVGGDYSSRNGMQYE